MSKISLLTKVVNQCVSRIRNAMNFYSTKTIIKLAISVGFVMGILHSAYILINLHRIMPISLRSENVIVTNVMAYQMIKYIEKVSVLQIKRVSLFNLASLLVTPTRITPRCFHI